MTTGEIQGLLAIRDTVTDSVARTVRTDDLVPLRRQVADLRDLVDGLTARLDAIEGGIRGDRKRKRQEAEAKAIADYMRSLPDPDAPYGNVHDGGDLHVHPPVDKPEHGDDQGALPSEITNKANPTR
jgi:hypothetical protein